MPATKEDEEKKQSTSSGSAAMANNAQKKGAGVTSPLSGSPVNSEYRCGREKDVPSELRRVSKGVVSPGFNDEELLQRSDGFDEKDVEASVMSLPGSNKNLAGIEDIATSELAAQAREVARQMAWDQMRASQQEARRSVDRNDPVEKPPAPGGVFGIGIDPSEQDGPLLAQGGRRWRKARSVRAVLEELGALGIVSLHSLRWGDECGTGDARHTRLTLKELSQTHHMRRRVFLDETKSAGNYTRNPTIMEPSRM